MYLNLKHFLMISFVLYLSCSPSFGLKKDSLERIFISADSGTYNYKTGIDVYNGHVKIDQGSSHLTADRLMTKRNLKNHQLTEATAYGNATPAHYWTLPNEKDPEIHAEAKIITLYPLESKVNLEKKVYLKQAENIFRGELICYNKQTQTVTVPPRVNSRATIIYHLKKSSL